MNPNRSWVAAATLTIATVGANVCAGVPSGELLPVAIALAGSTGVLGLAFVGGRTGWAVAGTATAILLICASVPVRGLLLVQRERWTRSAVEESLRPPVPAVCVSLSSALLLPVTCAPSAPGVEYAYYSPAVGWCRLRSNAPSDWDCVVEN